MTLHKKVHDVATSIINRLATHVITALYVELLRPELPSSFHRLPRRCPGGASAFSPIFARSSAACRRAGSLLKATTSEPTIRHQFLTTSFISVNSPVETTMSPVTNSANGFDGKCVSQTNDDTWRSQERWEHGRQIAANSRNRTMDEVFRAWVGARLRR
jgi:hypothetical protein